MKANSKFNIEDNEIVTSNVKYCKKCKTKNNTKAKFCLECGNTEFVLSLTPEKTNVKYCKKCGTEVKNSVKFCIECGCNEFVLERADDSSSKEREVDLKYEKELDKILKKIDKCKAEINDIDKANLTIENNIKKEVKKWESSIKTLKMEEEQSIIVVQKQTEDLDKYKKELASLKEEVKKINDKIKDSNRKKDFDINNTIALEKINKELLSKLANVKKDKTNLEAKLAKFEKQLADAKRKQEQDRIKAEQEKERRIKEAQAKEQALAAELKRLNSPEGKYPNIESKWCGGAFNLVIKDLEEIANAGYSKSFLLLGMAYEYGYSVSKSLDKARYWYQKSAQSGDPLGRFKSTNVGVKYYSSTDENLLIKLAGLEDITAMMTLGKLYQNSNQIGSMYSARNWYDKASKRNPNDGGEAAYLAGECSRKCYGSGMGTINYYIEAGYRGHKVSQKILADAYKNTNPALYVDKKDPEKYQFWMEKYKSKW